VGAVTLIQEGPTQLGGVMICGEAPGADEARFGRPFVGYSGHELDEQLGKAGFNRRDLFLTNVCHERPPGNEIEAFFARKSEARGAVNLDGQLFTAAAMAQLSTVPLAILAGRQPRRPILLGLVQLQRDIDRLQPRLIIALGNTALWALTGLTGITKWRGSILPATGGPVDGHGIKLIPTMHPAAVLREYPWHAVAIQDLRRAKRESGFPEIRRPAWRFTVPTTVAQVEQWFGDHGLFDDGPTVVSDVENFYESDRLHDGRLICVGFAASKLDAMCVPFVHRAGDDPHYWSAADELTVTRLCARVLRARPVCFHNGLHDCQIIARNWGIMSRFVHDTMVGQHVAFPGQLGGKIDPLTGKTSKKGSSLSLSFCSSMYCGYHRAWKDDGRGWDPEIRDERQYWNYNAEDCVRTFEVMEEEHIILKTQGLWDQYLFEMSLFEPVFAMMFRGMNFDQEERIKMRAAVGHAATPTRRATGQIAALQAWLDAAVGHPLNVESSPQMQQLFYDDFKVPPILHRKTRKPTLDDKALDTLIKRKPVLRPLIERIQGLRSLAVFKENFLDVRTSRADGRLRSAQNVVGPETMRFSSNINAFGEGFNSQNLPRSED
jgi:uracil-DNA glycosylase